MRARHLQNPNMTCLRYACVARQNTMAPLLLTVGHCSEVVQLLPSYQPNCMHP